MCVVDVGPELEAAVGPRLVTLRDALADAHANVEQVGLDIGRKEGLGRGGDWGGWCAGGEEGGDLALGGVAGSASELALGSRGGHLESR